MFGGSRLLLSMLGRIFVDALRVAGFLLISQIFGVLCSIL